MSSDKERVLDGPDSLSAWQMLQNRLKSETNRILDEFVLN